jgi:hypothetical protein
VDQFRRRPCLVLIDWLRNADRRVPTPERARVREGLVRALSVPAARPGAAPALIEEFRKASDHSETGLGWVAGNALSVVADDSVFDSFPPERRGRTVCAVVTG